MCKFCEEKEKITKWDLIFYIDKDSDLVATNYPDVEEDDELEEMYNIDIISYISINYCPMCGRKLKEGEENE